MYQKFMFLTLLALFLSLLARKEQLLGLGLTLRERLRRVLAEPPLLLELKVTLLAERRGLLAALPLQSSASGLRLNEIIWD